MDKIIAKIAGENNLDYDLVEKVIKSQFKFVADTMSEGNFESVMLHHLGKFAVKPKRLEKFQKDIYEENSK